MISLGICLSIILSNESYEAINICNNELAIVLGQFVMNSFGTSTLMKEILDMICFGNDYFGVTFDFDAFVAIQSEVDKIWKCKKEWTRRSILTTAGMGSFSSDKSYEIMY